MEQTLTVSKLEGRSQEELLGLAQELGIENSTNLRRDELVLRLLQANAEQ